MRAARIEIGDILGQDTLQMPLIENDQAVQAFFTHRPYLAFGDRVGIRGQVGVGDDLNTGGLKHGIK